MRLTTITISILLAWSYGPGPLAQAFEPKDGEFLAHKPCSAVQSIKSGANPGRIKLQIDQSYSTTRRSRG